MKKYKEIFSKRMRFVAFGILAFMAILAFATDVTVAAGVVGAMSVVIGSITLEGKEEEMYNALKATIENVVQKQHSGFISETKAQELIAAKIKELDFDLNDNEQFKELKKALETQGLTIKSLQENPRSAKGETIAEQIKKQMIERKDELARFKSGALQAFPLTIKVAAEMGSGNTNYTQEQIEPGYTVANRYKNTLLEWLRWGNSNKETFSYVQMINPDGAAAIQADGTIAPLVDFDIAKTSTTAADVVARVDISEDMLDDYDGIATLVQNELKYKIDLLTESSIYTVITTAAGGFVLTGLATVKPNTLDCIRAAVTQIEESGFGMADTVVLRPSEWYNLVSAKDSDAGYVMLPIVTFNGTVIDNLKVLKSTGIADGYLLVFDSSKVNVLNYMNYTASFGYIANNFGEFIMTLRGKRRLHKFVKSNDAGSFVYDAIATIKAAITEV